MSRRALPSWPMAGLSGALGGLVGTAVAVQQEALTVLLVLVVAIAAFAVRGKSPVESFGAPHRENAAILYVILIAALILPARYLNLPSPVRAIHPAAWLLALFATAQLLRRTQATFPAWPVALAWFTLGWGFASSAWNEDPIYSSTWWLLFVLTMGVSPLLLGQMPRRLYPNLRASYALLIAGVGGLAVAEWMTHRTVLSQYYESAGLTQAWASFRAMTTLGHPVSASLILALGGVTCLALALKYRAGFYWASFTLAALGAAATLTRGGFAALIAGSGWLLMQQLRSTRRGRASGAPSVVRAVALIALCAGIALSPPAQDFADRAFSEESRASTETRQRLLRQAIAEVRERSLVGVGPGRASAVSVEAVVARQSLPFENAWIELAIAVGVPGLFLVVALLVSVVRRLAGHTGRYAVLATLIVGGATFNAFEGNSAVWVLYPLSLAVLGEGDDLPSGGK